MTNDDMHHPVLSTVISVWDH